MLRQTLSTLLSNSKKLNTQHITKLVVFNRNSRACIANRTYCNSGSRPDLGDTAPKQADRAVAIFEKITRTDVLVNLLAGEISSELRENIILNPDRNSKLRHIEVTEDKIRLEYSEITPQFTVRCVSFHTTR